jgi:hypothetical protein
MSRTLHYNRLSEILLLLPLGLALDEIRAVFREVLVETVAERRSRLRSLCLLGGARGPRGGLFLERSALDVVLRTHVLALVGLGSGLGGRRLACSFH